MYVGPPALMSHFGPTPAVVGSNRNAFIAQATEAACRKLANEAIEAVTVVKDALRRLPPNPSDAARVLNGWAPDREDGTPRNFKDMLHDMLDEAEVKLGAVATQCRGLLGPAELKEVERKKKTIAPLRGLLDSMGQQPSEIQLSKLIEAITVFAAGFGKLLEALRAVAR